MEDLINDIRDIISDIQIEASEDEVFTKDKVHVLKDLIIKLAYKIDDLNLGD